MSNPKELGEIVATFLRREAGDEEPMSQEYAFRRACLVKLAEKVEREGFALDAKGGIVIYHRGRRVVIDACPVHAGSTRARIFNGGKPCGACGGLAYADLSANSRAGSASGTGTDCTDDCATKFCEHGVRYNSNVECVACERAQARERRNGMPLVSAPDAPPPEETTPPNVTPLLDVTPPFAVADGLLLHELDDGATHWILAKTADDALRLLLESNGAEAPEDMGWDEDNMPEVSVCSVQRAGMLTFHQDDGATTTMRSECERDPRPRCVGCTEY